MAISRDSHLPETRHHRLSTVISLAVVLVLGVLGGCTNDTRDTPDTPPPAADTGTGGSEASTAQVADTGPAADGALVSVLTGDGRYNTLVNALRASGVAEKLSRKGPFTVFAPTDQAFQRLPSEILGKLLLPENASTLEKVLKYHVLGGLMPTASINEGDQDTLEGKKVHFAYTNGEATINGVGLVSELSASNGIIHGIDFVLVPPGVDLNSLKGSVASTQPTAIPSIGVPILKTLEEQGNFTTLLSAIDSAGLREQLAGAGPFTLFAPTDQAFQRLPGDTLRKLLLPGNRDALVTILRHHVIAKRVNGRDLKDQGDLAMLDGSTAKIGIVQGRISVEDATMTFADREATTGVIHTIDSVLRPGSVDLAALTG